MMHQIVALPLLSPKVYSPWFQEFPLQDGRLEFDSMVGADEPGDLADVSSAELLVLARDGDRQAIDRLISRYLPILRHWAAGRLPRAARDLVDTDDMIQETLIKTLRNVGSFVPRHDGALGAYLRQALNNRIRDEIRRVQARPLREPLRDEHHDVAASPLAQALGGEALRRYEQALERLADEERELVLARIEMGLTYDEVAHAMNKPTADAARMAVGRALVRLASLMDQE